MADLKWILAFLAVGAVIFLLLLSPGLSPNQLDTSADIKVEGIKVNWSTEVKFSTNLAQALAGVRPRIVVDYATVSAYTRLVQSSDFLAAVADVAPRIVIKHAATTASRAVVRSEGLMLPAANTLPRVIVQGAATSVANQHLCTSESLIPAGGKLEPRILLQGVEASELQTTGPNPRVLLIGKDTSLKEER